MKKSRKIKRSRIDKAGVKTVVSKGLLILLLCLSKCIYAQGNYYTDYLPYDSTGEFREKIVIRFDSTTYVPKSDSHLYLDSISLKKMDYLNDLIRKNPKLVIEALLYDEFYILENNSSYGANFTYHRAERILRKLSRGIDGVRIKFVYTSRNQEGFTNEHLLSRNKRLEFLVYELHELPIEK